ncbi:MAG TPA: hypothetical protein VM639_12830 [Dongiaceae bacterium]|nr:hypothetical protein [Dongiaceae bacterium]
MKLWVAGRAVSIAVAPIVVMAIELISIAAAFSGCAAGKAPPAALPPAPPPPSVGNGIGSQYGNYAAQAAGEMHGPAGERCVVFNWDRPLTKDFVLRLTSASCESAERPGWMIARELSRTVIPMSQSYLKDARAAGQQ